MTKVTNNENMRRYVHMALAKQASQAAGGGLSPEEVEAMINQALEEYSEAELQKAIDNDYFVLDPGEDQYAYGVLIDFTEGKSSPDLKRIGNMELHRTLPVQSQYKGCIWDYMNQEIVYYLNPENWNLAVNDEVHNVQKTAEEVATDMIHLAYDIRVETPKFYASSKVLATDGAGHTTMAKVMFSTIKLNASYIEIPRQVTDFRPCRYDNSVTECLVCNLNEYDVVGGYATTKNTDLGCQSSLYYPITNWDREHARQAAHNANTNLMCYEYYKWLFYWAFVIEYATLNSHKPVNNELDENGFHQGGLGGGLTNFVENNGISLQDTTGKDKCRYIGVTNELGNGTGELSVPTDTGLAKTGHPNRYRGFECPFGDITLMLDGFLGVPVLNGDGMAFYDYYSCCNPEYFADDIPLPWDTDNDYSTEISNQWTKIARYQDLTTTDIYDGDEGDGLWMGYLTKYISIGNRGELLPQMWQNESEKYFVDSSTVKDKYGSQKAILHMGSSSGGSSSGLGCLDASSDPSYAENSLGFRCFNIIKDDGTVI